MPIQHTAKMNRIILLLIVLAASAIGASAQSQIATLSHEGAVTPYYGYDALKMALANCQDGDIITLSPGMFNAADTYIKKSITLRGYSAWEEDKQTIIKNGITVRAAEEGQRISVVMDGIRFMNESRIKNGVDLEAKKVYFHQIEDTENGNKVSLYNCEINHTILRKGNASYTLVNCVTHGDYHGEGIGNTISDSNVVNCNIGGISGLKFVNLTNCIITGSFIDETCYSINCLSNTEFYNNAINCQQTENKESPFKDDTFYELKEQYAEIMGNDGTQVGIYGGLMPWSWAPSQPKITKFNVARRTNDDGKLPVEIEVESPNN